MVCGALLPANRRLSSHREDIRIALCNPFRGHGGAGAWVFYIIVDVARPGAEVGVRVFGWWCTFVARRYFLVVRFS